MAPHPATLSRAYWAVCLCLSQAGRSTSLLWSSELQS
uniref:Uncharacterized protein n=1 Tax=Anguilla anguilla TaxID=7936 RepID=A0A0E9P905_ANGAN